MTDDVSEQGLLDTSAVIDLGDLDPESLPAEPSICSITLAELSVGPLVGRTDEERGVRQRLLQQVEANFDPIPFDAAAARAFGQVAALRASGRKPAARAYDALIAAVAVAHQLPLYTSNSADFHGIPGLDLRSVRFAEEQAHDDVRQ